MGLEFFSDKRWYRKLAFFYKIVKRLPTIHYLLPSKLYSVQRAELYDGVYRLDSTLQNSSEGQLLTVLSHASEIFALNVNKDIISLTISYYPFFDQ